MKPIQIAVASACLVALAGCAGSISEPTVVQPLAPDQQAGMHISDISADAASGVEMSDGDFGLISQKVRGYIEQNSPGVMVDPATGQALHMKIHFTRFDRGNAFARAMLIGLGQIRIEASVSLENAAGTPVAQYEVAKDFALGGVVGATTKVDDVEDGFAKSVAEIVKQKA
jgi:hypothetical protein